MSQAAISGALDYQGDVTAEPLRPDEIKLIHRLLSDPSILPRDFKQWVTDHSSDTVDIAKSQVHGLINSAGSLIFTAASWEQLGIALCPMIVPYPAAAVPASTWFWCDGSMYDQTVYPALYGYLGHQHDIIVSTGAFGVPDLRGRAIYGIDGAGGPFAIGLGQHDSASPGGRGPWHHHTVPDHAHGMNHAHYLAQALYASGGAGGAQGAGSDMTTGGPTFVNTSPGGGGPTSGAPPLDGGAYYGLNYIIANGKIP